MLDSLWDVQAGHIPRAGSSIDFKHPGGDYRNWNLCRPYESFDRETTAFIFVSHRWLRPRPGTAGHPDDFRGRKHALIAEACERLRGPRAPIPEDMDIALWIDYCAPGAPRTRWRCATPASPNLVQSRPIFPDSLRSPAACINQDGSSDLTPLGLGVP